jgi:hypothetical protein
MRSKKPGLTWRTGLVHMAIHYLRLGVTIREVFDISQPDQGADVSGNL